jgi:thiol:disulfide interchange protein
MGRGIGIVIVLVGVAAVVGTSLLRRSHEVVPWRTDLDAALAESGHTGKPALLDFSAEWCGPCQEMRRTTWSDPAVAKALQGYIPVQINVDAHSDWAGKFGVMGIPHLTLIDPNGTVLKTQEGALSSDQFLEWLKQR